MFNSTPPNPAPPSSPIRVVSSSHSSLKVILIGLAITVLIGGIGTAIYLVRQRQQVAVEAWDCTRYNFNVSQTGVVTANNQSTINETPQKVSISINGSPVALLDVPALPAGASATIGTVDVPASGTFSWQAVGTVDCSDQGSYIGQSPTPTPIPPTATPTSPVTPTPTTPVTSPTATPVITSTPTPTTVVTPTVTPTGTPGPTATPGPTSTPVPTTPPNNPNSCGGTCGSDANCQVDLICYQGLCRRPACPDSESCACAPDVPYSTPTPTPISQLPSTGAVENTWIITGSALIFIGLGLLLAL